MPLTHISRLTNRASSYSRELSPSGIIDIASCLKSTCICTYYVHVLEFVHVYMHVHFIVTSHVCSYVHTFCTCNGLLFYSANRGSADAIKQAHHYITLLMRDPSRNLAQLLPKPLTNTSQVNRTTASGGAGGEPPSAATLDSSEDMPDALPNKGSNMAASVSSTMTSTAAGRSCQYL